MHELNNNYSIIIKENGRKIEEINKNIKTEFDAINKKRQLQRKYPLKTISIKKTKK